MSGLANLVVKHKKAILALFIAAAAICGIAVVCGCKLQYGGLSAAGSTVDKSAGDYAGRIRRRYAERQRYGKDVSIEEALAYKQKLAEVSGSTAYCGSTMWQTSNNRSRQRTQIRFRAITRTETPLYRHDRGRDGAGRPRMHPELIGEDARLRRSPDLATMQQATGAEVGTQWRSCCPSSLLS